MSQSILPHKEFNNLNINPKNCKLCQILLTSKKLTPENLLSLEALNTNTSEEDLFEIISNIRSVRRSRSYNPTHEALVLRNQMLTWISFTCKQLNLYDLTFYTALDIFDEVLNKFEYMLSNDDLVLIAITCIFISSKLNETNQLGLDFIIGSLGHGKYEKDDFLMTELLILKTINFKIPKNYFLDFVNCTLKNILPSMSCYCTCYIYKLIKNCYTIASYDLCFFRETDLISLYFALIYQALLEMKDCCGNMNTINAVLSRLNQSMKIYNINTRDVINCSSLIYEMMYPCDSNNGDISYITKQCDMMAF
jgi:hypothetical protein